MWQENCLKIFLQNSPPAGYIEYIQNLSQLWTSKTNFSTSNKRKLQKLLEALFSTKKIWNAVQGVASTAGDQILLVCPEKYLLNI